MKRLILIIALSIVATISYSQDKNNAYAPGDYIPTSQSGKWGYKQFGEWVIEPKYEVARDFSDGLAAVCLYGKWGFIAKNGKSSIAYRYDQCGSFSEGLARVRLYGKWGFIDKNGELLIPFKYSRAGDFTNGLAKVSLGEKSGYIDKTGEWFDTAESMKQSFRAFARHYVENDINQWQKKGKYEKYSQWEARVNDQNRQKRIDSLLVAASNEFIKSVGKDVRQEYAIVDYDSEGEVFLLHDTRFGNLIVPVPIREAEAFELNFDRIRREDVYCINGDDLDLKESKLTTPNGRVYRYKNDAPLSFTSIDIDYTFDPVSFDDNSLALSQNKQQQSINNLKAGPSDVDVKIPKTNYKNENTFALIFANENYRFNSRVPFAANDGKVFEEYCLKTLGLPRDNVRLVKDATYGMMIGAMNWISEIAKAYKGEARLIVYYSGHGIPDESTHDPFILPQDGSSKDVNTAIKLSSLYAKLNENPTKSNVVFLDACFSGAKRDGQMLNEARGVVIRHNPVKVSGKTVVFSASSGDETAYAYDEKGHGMFSYYLLKKLQESSGEATLGELAEYIIDNVSKNSLKKNSKSQTPTVIYSNEIGDKWQSLKLK